MKAAVIDRYGSNDVVELRDVPQPQPGPDDVLIRVHVASINPVDWKIRSGSAKMVSGGTFPKILGSECAGEVVAVGSRVQRFKEGDQVIGFPGVRRLAAFAEYVCTPERTTFLKGAKLTFPEAATLPIAALTALQALRDLRRLGPGRHVLINGASGGVGTFAVQIAKTLGAKVTAVCSGVNAKLVRTLGADQVIDYTREEFTQGIERYDLVFDAVAKSSFAAAKRVLAPKGIYVSTLPSLDVLLSQFVTGYLTSQKARSIMVRPNAQDIEWMKEEIEAGRIRVVIDREFPLKQIRKALAYSETGRARGKVVVKF